MKLLVTAFVLLASSVGLAEVKIGAAAPAFTEIDHAGKTHSLDSHKGKWVVLEWYNEGCPYVKKHYGAKNMQTLQKTFADKGVVWLTVATSPEGQQGYVAPKEAAAHMKKAGMHSTALLLDSDGTMGRAFDAKTTPHMFVIDPKGMVVYAGAIDNNDSSDPRKIASSTNYVADALNSALKGEAVKVATTKPYGCGVKYN
ncbi:MAG: thioredoxin family protein [Bdellovibrionota bacterium]